MATVVVVKWPMDSKLTADFAQVSLCSQSYFLAAIQALQRNLPTAEPLLAGRLGLFDSYSVGVLIRSKHLARTSEVQMMVGESNKNPQKGKRLV